MDVPITALIISLSTSSPMALAIDCRNLFVGSARVTKFKKADVDMKKDPVTIVLSPDQMEDLFKAVEIGSADYNPIRSLYYGEVFSATNRLYF
jgi:hypothetical protein